MSIGCNIAMFRKERHLTQGKLGELVGVTNQTVSKWELGISLPDVELIPFIANALDITLDQIYGIAGKKEEPEFVYADTFPDVAYHYLHKLFYDMSRVRFTIIPEEEQLNYQVQKLCQGLRLGCLSNESGAVVITDKFSFIDRSFKSVDGVKLFDSLRTAKALKILSNSTVRKILIYEYTEAFKQSKKDNCEFSLDNIINNCGSTEDETMEALENIISLKLNEYYYNSDEQKAKYVFKISYALYAYSIYMIADILLNDETWLVVRDSSMISDYTFEYAGN